MDLFRGKFAQARIARRMKARRSRYTLVSAEQAGRRMRRCNMRGVAKHDARGVACNEFMDSYFGSLGFSPTALCL